MATGDRAQGIGQVRCSEGIRQACRPGAQKKQADTDAVAMGVGLVLFWPALFFLAGDDQKEELARLKGEYEALQQAAIQKDCEIAQ